MQQLATLYKINGVVVFYGPNIPTIGPAAICTDVFNKSMDIKTANYDKAIMQSLTVPRNTVEEIYKNISIAPVIIAIVRTELLEKPNPMEYIEKLSAAIGLVQVGLFAEARVFILSFKPDDVLTDEQLNRWASLLESADSITNNNEIE